MTFYKTVSRTLLLIASLCSAVQPAFADFKTRVPLTVTAINPNLTAINLGAAPVGVTQQTSTYFTNSTGVAINLTPASITTTGDAQLVSTTCIGTVAAGSSCSMTVNLTVPVEGPVSGSVVVATGNPAGPDAIVISANGLTGVPGLVSTPSMVNFGMQGVGLGSGPTHTVVVSNTGDVAADISTIQSPSTSYLVDPSGCRLVLAPGDTCSFAVQFSPQSVGTLNANLTAKLADGTTLALTALTGMGVQGVPKWILNPGFQFNDMPQGVWSPDRSVQLQNIGFGDLKINSVVVQGDATAVLSSTDCPIGGFLAPNATCTATVRAMVNDLAVHTSELVVQSSQSSKADLRLQIDARSLYSQAVALPSWVDFGDVSAGHPTTQTVIFANPGNTSFNINSITTAAPFSVTDDCGGVVPAGGSCLINITILTSDLGMAYDSVIVDTDANIDGFMFIDLFANVIPATDPMFDTSTPSVNFGGVNVGSNSTLAFSVLNSGGVPLTLTSIGVTGATDFTATHNCNGIAMGASCDVQVTYAPTSAGAAVGTVTLTDGTNTRTVALTGTGLAASLSVNSSSMTFGSVTTGTTTTQDITVTNNGNASAVLGVSPVGSGYSVSGTCGATLAAGATCTVTVTFAPTAVQAYPGTLTLTGSDTGPVLVPVSGSGVAPLFTSYDVSPDSVDFGAIEVSQVTSVNVAILNTGTRTLSLIAPLSSDAHFSSVTNCDAIAPNDICMANIVFAPTATGLVQGTLVLDDGTGIVRNVALSGQGVQAALTVSTALVDFGTVTVGQSRSEIVTVVNTGGLDAAMGIATSGGYLITDSTCTETLAAGASCQMTVTLAPLAVQTYSGSLEIAGSTDGVRTVSLTGAGVAPAPHWAVSSATLDFGTVSAGSVSTQSVTVTNDGPTYIAGVTLGSSGTGFSAITSATGDCALGLVPGASCTVLVTFEPVTPSTSYTGSLALTANGLFTDVSIVGATDAVVPVVPAGPSSAVDLGSYHGVDLGNIPAGQLLAIPVDFTNYGSFPVTVSSYVALNYATAGSVQFSTAELPHCTNLAVGATCTGTIHITVPLDYFYVEIAPVAHFVDSATGQPVTMDLYDNFAQFYFGGFGTAPGALTASTASLGMGWAAIGTTTTQSFQLNNLGVEPLTVASMTVTGAQSLTAAQNCYTLAPGSSCQVTVTFAPTTVGPATGTLTVTPTNGTAPVVVTLAGEGGLGPLLDVAVQGVSAGTVSYEGTPVSAHSLVSLGAVPMGAGGSVNTYTATVTNLSAISMNMAAAPGDAGALTVSSTCSLHLAPGESCVRVFRVKSTGYGMLTANLNFAYALASGGAVTAVVPVSYVATAPYTLTSADFGAVTAGSSSTRSFTLTNSTSQPSTMAWTMPSSSFAASGFSANCAGGTLPANATCTFNVTFTPVAKDFASLSYGSLVFTGTYAKVSSNVSAQAYTPPPPPPPPTPVNPTPAAPRPVLDIRVITNQQMNPVLYGDQGHYFSSYDASCSGGYAAKDACMLQLVANSYKAQYGPYVSCYGIQTAGPYPYFASWGYMCRNN